MIFLKNQSLQVTLIMSDFTYKIPNEENFLRAVLINLKQKGHDDIASLLEGSKCTISHAGQFSRKRWDAYWTTIHFDIPMNKYEEVMSQITEEIREIIRTICDEVMPMKSGLDVMGVKFSLSLEDVPRKKDLMTDLKKITDELPPELMTEIIPEDIKNKAREMSETYVYLYCIENSLRKFIEKIAKENYGEDYLKNLKLNTDMKRKIRNRKESQAKKKWLSVRGDSDIFYLDMDELGKIIRNNWNIFEPYFESQEWIVTNINELGDCRNPVAHHSYIEENVRDIVRINFFKITQQIREAFRG